MIWVLFTSFGTWVSSCTGFPVVSIFLVFEAPQGCWDALLNLLKPKTNLGSMCQDVSVGLVRSSPFLMEILLIFVNLSFLRADAISSSVASANSVLLITRFEVLSFSFRRMKSFHFKYVFCLPPFVHINKQVSVPCLSTIFVLALIFVTFSKRKEDNLAKQTSSKYSMTMNLGKSAASHSESDSERFRFAFFIWRRHDCNLFFITHHEVQLVLRMYQGETHSLWLRRIYTTSILELVVDFQAVANFRFSILIKFLSTKRNWLSTTAF